MEAPDLGLRPFVPMIRPGPPPGISGYRKRWRVETGRLCLSTATANNNAVDAVWLKLILYIFREFNRAPLWVLRPLFCETIAGNFVCISSRVDVCSITVDNRVSAEYRRLHRQTAGLWIMMLCVLRCVLHLVQDAEYAYKTYNGFNAVTSIAQTECYPSQIKLIR